MNHTQNNASVVFGIGTGRCGTMFLSEVLKNEPNVGSFHEKNPTSDTFHRFCKWYGLDVDSSGFLETKKREILQNSKKNTTYFESSAYLSLSLQELYEHFNAKFIFLVRAPEKVVNSYLAKKWYQDEIYYTGESGILPSFQPDMTHVHHFLGRTIPKEAEKYKEWIKLTQIGKLSWYWNTLNNQIVQQLKNIPESHKLIVQLEQLNYSKYKKIAEFIGLNTVIRKSHFKKIVKSKPNTKISPKKISDWTELEIRQFKSQLNLDLLQFLGYNNSLQIK